MVSVHFDSDQPEKPLHTRGQDVPIQIIQSHRVLNCTEPLWPPEQIKPLSAVKIRSGFSITFGNWRLNLSMICQFVVAILLSSKPVLARIETPVQIAPIRTLFWYCRTIQGAIEEISSMSGSTPHRWGGIRIKSVFSTASIARSDWIFIEPFVKTLPPFTDTISSSNNGAEDKESTMSPLYCWCQELLIEKASTRPEIAENMHFS